MRLWISSTDLCFGAAAFFSRFLGHVASLCDLAPQVPHLHWITWAPATGDGILAWTGLGSGFPVLADEDLTGTAGGIGSRAIFAWEAAGLV